MSNLYFYLSKLQEQCFQLSRFSLYFYLSTNIYSSFHHLSGETHNEQMSFLEKGSMDLLPVAVTVLFSWECECTLFRGFDVCYKTTPSMMSQNHCFNMEFTACSWT